MMSERTRRILLQGVIVTGVVVPFALGAVSQFLMPRISRNSDTIDSVTGPRTSSFRSRFDAVQIGMTVRQVEALLGNPSQDKYIDPTHAETWFSENGEVSHKTWGPPWKVYWLFTSVDDKSRWWSDNGCQAFVLFDDNQKVDGKMWLENRTKNSSG